MAVYSLLVELVDDCLDFVNNYDVNKREINILCFGDSITGGYTNHGLEYYPYSDKLKKIMVNYVLENNKYKEFGIEYEIYLHNVGKNGERISDTMHDRLFQILLKSDIIFDLIIITGGANDIYAGYSIDKIWNNHNKNDKKINDIDFMESSSSIKQIYEMVPKYKQNKNIKIVGVTITSFNFFQTEIMNEIRNTLNKRIVNYCNDNNHMILCDLDKKFPKFDKTSKYWEIDGVHFTKLGYALFAEFLFQSIKPWLDSKISR